MQNHINKAFIIITILIQSMNIYSWKNWAGNQECSPKEIFYPKTVEEIKYIIKQAHDQKKKIRPIGSGHSWSEIICPGNIFVDLKNLDKVLKVDQSNKQVTVQAGIKLKDLYKELAKNGLALENQAAIQDQAIAGTISTATHGSGKTGTLANFIVGIDLITADGQTLHLSPTKNKDLFWAACTSLGAIGIIYSLTAQCVDLIKLKETRYQTNWSDIKNKYNQLLKDNDYFQFTIDPYTYGVSVTLLNKIYNGQTNSNLINKHTITREDYSHKILSGDPGSLYFEEEIAIEKKDFLKAIEEVFKVIKKWQDKDIRISYILIRFATPDLHNLLSHAAGRDTIFISIMTEPSQKYYPFYKDFYDSLLPFKGRPHWGKINFLTAKDVAWLYGENFTKFKEIRDNLDPERIFSNNFINSIFGF